MLQMQLQHPEEALIASLKKVCKWLSDNGVLSFPSKRARGLCCTATGTGLTTKQGSKARSESREGQQERKLVLTPWKCMQSQLVLILSVRRHAVILLFSIFPLHYKSKQLISRDIQHLNLKFYELHKNNLPPTIFLLLQNAQVLFSLLPNVCCIKSSFYRHLHIGRSLYFCIFKVWSKSQPMIHENIILHRLIFIPLYLLDSNYGNPPHEAGQ